MLQHQWDRLLHQRPRPDGSVKLTMAISTVPPRDPNDDDADEEEDNVEDNVEVDREPAVIREPDRDE